MLKTEIKQQLGTIQSYKEEILSMIDFDTLNKEIKTLDTETYDQGFWDDQEHAQKVIKELKIKKNKQEKIQNFLDLHNECIEASEMVEEDNDEMAFLFKEVSDTYISMYHQLSVELLLSGEFDASNAVLEIHPGAGGTESQDWADMLYRMFKRYAEQQNFTIEILDYQAGDEAGIKSVTFMIKGDFTYGYLKSEHGVHRLVRISPFDSGGRRHTSFASVNVIPELDDDINIEINEKELKIDTYRSSGAGGQSVNTTDSAVRITHIPSKIVVTVQNERSQIKNRDKAMSILKSRLYQLELERKQEEVSTFRSTNVSNSFGSQIRSYVMHPYSMVKDHRTNHETGNVGKVMDGDLQPFMNAYLKMNAVGE